MILPHFLAQAAATPIPYVPPSQDNNQVQLLQGILMSQFLIERYLLWIIGLLVARIMFACWKR